MSKGEWRSIPSLVAGVVAVVAGLLLAQAARAKVDLVTLPPRGEVQITIYNTEDLTLAIERRTMTFKKGINEIQFSWANTLIDPTSLNLRFREREEDYPILEVTYPPNAPNTLIWRVEAAKEGPAPIEIMYFTSGLTWAADYVARADADEKTLRLESYVRVTNNSGEDYENTQTRLLVGEIHLVEDIADLARRGMDEKERLERYAGRRAERKAMAKTRLFEAADMAAPMAAGLALQKPKEVQKEAVSDYFLYTVEGRESIDNQWSKRLRSFVVDDIPIKVRYEYNPRKYGNRVVKFYKFKNKDEENDPDKEPAEKLGQTPLPNGVFHVYREGGEAGLSYTNAYEHKYIPIGEDVELNLGDDGLVVIEPKTMDFKRERIKFRDNGNVSGWDEIRDMRVELRNSKTEDVTVEVTQFFGGDFEVDTKAPYEKRAEDEYKFTVTVPALGEADIEYELTTHHGENATKSPRPIRPNRSRR